MPLFRKKPVVIEAEQTHTRQEIYTLEGVMVIEEALKRARNLGIQISGAYYPPGSPAAFTEKERGHE